jgi:excisionase family DNA binding protein
MFAAVATEEFVSTKQLAAQLGLTEVTLCQWRHRGQGPAFIRMGRTVRYRRTDVESWLAARTVGASASRE